MADAPTEKGQNIIIKYLQQILIVAVIGFGSWLFKLVTNLEAQNADKDKVIINLQDQIRDMKDDLVDDEAQMDNIRAQMEAQKDDHNRRLIHLEDWREFIKPIK